MNRQEFEDAARRYREEMFRMYAARQLDPPPKPRPQQPAPPPPRAVPAMQDLPPQDVPAAPAPPDPPPESAPQPMPAPSPDDGSLGKRPYTGIITVHVTTGLGAMPVPGASVMITRETGGETHLISIQTTDQSGLIRPVTVPAPPPSEDQRDPACFRYGISAEAEGYYREHSTDVPVFPGITSMQNFDLIPLPAGEEGGGDITYYNNMQQF